MRSYVATPSGTAHGTNDTCSPRAENAKLTKEVDCNDFFCSYSPRLWTAAPEISSYELDDFDLRILSLLLHDARIKHLDLAGSVGLSATACA